MEGAARIVIKNGGIGVDLNMGCSAPQIYKYGAGIAWMFKPESETMDMLSQSDLRTGTTRFISSFFPTQWPAKGV